jgi:hypothetical protein
MTSKPVTTVFISAAWRGQPDVVITIHSSKGSKKIHGYKILAVITSQSTVQTGENRRHWFWGQTSENRHSRFWRQTIRKHHHRFEAKPAKTGWVVLRPNHSQTVDLGFEAQPRNLRS